MKTVQATTYQCEICEMHYDTAAQARECEARPVRQDKGVKVGDTVIVLGGDGAGERAVVRRTFVYDRTWGHSQWERYWHTVGIAVVFTSGDGRALTFSDYRGA